MIGPKKLIVLLFLVAIATTTVFGNKGKRNMKSRLHFFLRNCSGHQPTLSLTLQLVIYRLILKSFLIHYTSQLSPNFDRASILASKGSNLPKWQVLNHFEKLLLYIELGEHMA